jgi:hypothetical protein
MSPGRLRFHRYLPNSPRVFYTSLRPHTCYRAHGRIAGRGPFDAVRLFGWYVKSSIGRRIPTLVAHPRPGTPGYEGRSALFLGIKQQRFL